MRHMRRGEWPEAWRVADAVLRAHGGARDWYVPRHLQAVWGGSPIVGRRVLIRCYHGLGDTIQFIRYAPLLKAIAAEVIVWAQPKLLPLLRTVDGIDRLLPLHDGAPEAAFDVDVEVMELPHVFRTTPASVPTAIPYLRVEPMPLPSPPGQRSIGLVWKAGDWDPDRSIPFALLARFATLRDTAIFILQPDAAAAGWRGKFGAHPGELDLFDYARAIRAIDLLVSIDSMPAHLAGALGVPVWTLLAADADWRWMQDRADSPWYPTMRLFRQRRPGDWSGVIGDVIAELEQLPARARHRAGARPPLSAGRGA